MKTGLFACVVAAMLASPTSATPPPTDGEATGVPRKQLHGFAIATPFNFEIVRVYYRPSGMAPSAYDGRWLLHKGPIEWGRGEKGAGANIEIEDARDWCNYDLYAEAKSGQRFERHHVNVCQPTYWEVGLGRSNWEDKIVVIPFMG